MENLNKDRTRDRRKDGWMRIGEMKDVEKKNDKRRGKRMLSREKGSKRLHTT